MFKLTNLNKYVIFYVFNYNYLLFYRNSYDSQCLALYGGPVDPAIALGGFLEPGESLSKTAHYENATAVILTFLVNNYYDKAKLTPTLRWEHLYVTFLSLNLIYV